MRQSDTYRTILKPSAEVIFRDKGSKFLGYTFPLQNEESIKEILNDLKRKHPKARHWCYAWRQGVEGDKIQFRVNDDGEPSNSAGQPIYGQLLSKNVTNILVVVVRYYGGTKLGVSGLINAYKTAAAMALKTSEIVEKLVEISLSLIFEYKDMNKVLRVIKDQNLRIVSQKMELKCEFLIAVRKNEASKAKSALESLRCTTITEV
ncbi:MAG: YigZ family protein [Flavobacteriaceae bacterium]|nr:YigZ family protein [Flavobacteriaceae bacterium]